MKVFFGTSRLSLMIIERFFFLFFVFFVFVFLSRRVPHWRLHNNIIIALV